MEEPEGSYAPESPDLSAYHSAPVQPVTHTYALRSNQSSATPSQGLFETAPSNQRCGAASSGQMPFSEAPDAMEDGPTSGSPEPRVPRKPSRRNQSEGEIDIKTKFPVARIKRIMQADEDVGKVSQVTPIAVSKALELFMISLVSKAADEARAASSKRITTKHLKQAVAKEEEYDFLQEIISKVPEAPAGEEKGEQGDGDELKRRRAAGKGKRKASEEF